jgi:hypothetical protein
MQGLRSRPVDIRTLRDRRGWRREREIEMDLETEDAPYDRNRCPLCGGYAVWGSDFNYDEVFGEGQGIATYMSCMRCHATFQYSIRDDDPDCDSDPIPAEAI